MPPGPLTVYDTVLAVATLAVLGAVLVQRSRWGLALVGIGADEERVETLGVDTTRVKVAAFALSGRGSPAPGA